MKFSKMNLKYVLIVMASVALFSCSKAEDGATGPAGPAGQNGVNGADGLNGGQDGADGADGTNGAAGANGTNGADGNANVISSGWFTFENSDWSANSNNSSQQTLFTATKDEPEITQEVIDNAAILTYVDFGPGNSGVYALPRILQGSGSTYVHYINQTGEISFRHYKLDGSATSRPSASYKYRYVIIPPSAAGKSSIDFTKMTYKEVMDHFGLEY